MRDKRKRQRQLLIRVSLVSFFCFCILLCMLFIKPKSKNTDEEYPEDSTKSEVGTEVIHKDEEIYTYTLADIQDMEAASSLTESMLTSELIDQLFYSTEITESIQERILNNSYQENDYISLDELRYLRVLYRGGDGRTHIGELIVNQKISDEILSIMKELYLHDYPIEKMVLVDEYHADDEASMTDNNSSAFNFRMVSGTDSLSKHSLGMAIDINPLYNPYVVNRNGETTISPAAGSAYADREFDFEYKLTKDDFCVKLFLEHGYTWGGNWNSVKDYQHFEKDY